MNNKKTYLITALIIITCILALFILELIAPSAYEKITGLSISQAYITPAQPVNCTGTLYTGWNMVSFYCIAGEMPLEDLKDQSNNSINPTYIFSYNPGNIDNSWFSYNPNLPNWTVQDLSRIDRKKGYWIYMGEVKSFSIEGYLFEQTSIPLAAGYNLIGYSTNNTSEINQSFSSIDGNYTMVWTYTASGSTWRYYDPNDNGSTLNETKIPEAYWVNTTGSITWVVDW
jgi:hypothetical protein